jgi:hypothetical protein
MYTQNNKEHLINFRVFYKTKEEKAAAHTIKKQWKATMKMFYGDQWRKHNNYPETLSKH